MDHIDPPSAAAASKTKAAKKHLRDVRAMTSVQSQSPSLENGMNNAAAALNKVKHAYEPWPPVTRSSWLSGTRQSMPLAASRAQLKQPSLQKAKIALDPYDLNIAPNLPSKVVSAVSFDKKKFKTL